MKGKSLSLSEFARAIIFNCMIKSSIVYFIWLISPLGDWRKLLF
jgi:hypothetical protein